MQDASAPSKEQLYGDQAQLAPPLRSARRNRSALSSAHQVVPEQGQAEIEQLPNQMHEDAPAAASDQQSAKPHASADSVRPASQTLLLQQKPAVERDEFDELERKKPKSFCSKVLRAVFSHIGMIVLVGLYCVAGAFIFQHLEATNEEQACYQGRTKYQQVLEASATVIWDIVNRNDLTEEDKRQQFSDTLDQFRLGVQNSSFKSPLDKDCSDVDNWTFFGSLLFAVTIVTTVGYGFIAPVTFWGRMVCIAYAILGIPLMLMCLANIGELLADGFRYFYFKVCCCGCFRRKKPKEHPAEPTWQVDGEGRPVALEPGQPTIIETNDDVEEELQTVTVPLTISLIVIATFVSIGAGIYSATENWPFADACYFSFITISTIGFGDLVPGVSDQRSWSAPWRLVITCFYMMIGMALISMLFALMQEEVIAKVSWLAEKLGIVDRDNECESDDEPDEEPPNTEAKPPGAAAAAPPAGAQPATAPPKPKEAEDTTPPPPYTSD